MYPREIEQRVRHIRLVVFDVDGVLTDKAAALAGLLAKTGLDATACAYVGDDLPDLEAFQRVGLAIAVPNGQPEVRQAAHLVTARAGGQGAASDVCRLLLAARDGGETAPG